MASTIFGPPLTDEQRQRWQRELLEQELPRWQERLMARQPRPVPHQRFGYNQWREIVDANPDHTDLMLTRQQWDELRRHLMERMDIVAPFDTGAGAGLQFEGRNIHIMPEDPPPPERVVREDIQDLRDRLTDTPLDPTGGFTEAIRAFDPGRPEEAEPAEPPHAGLDINDPFSPQRLENAINFHINRFDYDQMLGVSGEITLRNAIRTPVRGLTPAQIEEQTFEMKRMLISRFTSALNRTPEYRNIDDTLRDFIFWLHKNIDPDKRSIADRRFAEMRDQIWPADSQT